MAYIIDVYLVGQAAPLSHSVLYTQQALDALREITEKGLYRVNDLGTLEWYPVSRISEVAIFGPDLESHGLAEAKPRR